jgi:serpin B
MGLASAFHAGAADFSAVSPDPIQLDAVCHKALVEVNERGTEAAAATAATMVLGIDGSKPRPFHMILDRPFIFTICDIASGALLFSGVLEDPRG